VGGMTSAVFTPRILRFMLSRRRSHAFLLPLLALATLSTAARGDEYCPARGWQMLTPYGPTPRTDSALVYDSVRQQAVLFGGAAAGFQRDSWTWSGAVWQRTASLPNGRSRHAAAFDPNRGICILFGGNQSLTTTALWTGESWTAFETPTNPNQWPGDALALLGRLGHAMAFDSRLGRVVMLGGSSAFGLYPATLWAFDGADWSMAADYSAAPTPRTEHALVCDDARGQLLLFGGQTASSYSGETWTWDDDGWILRATDGPAPRSNHAMAFDAAREVIVLFGGQRADGSLLNDTWEWTGTSWTQSLPPASPSRRRGHSLAFDAARGVILLHGGFRTTGSNSAETWEFDGQTWTQRTPEFPLHPGARENPSMVYDHLRDRIVLHGGSTNSTSLRDTWEWDPVTQLWLRRVTDGPAFLVMPPAIAFDSLRGRTILCGSGRTWQWDAITWSEQINAGRPTADSGMAMTFDAAHGVVVLFGGSERNLLGWPPHPPLDETWTFDGTIWTLTQPATRPPPRAHATIAYDPVEQRTLLFGGLSLDAPLGDTWSWDGADWTLRAMAGPAPRTAARMAYNHRQNALVLVGGSLQSGTLSPETWRWERASNTWTRLGIVGPAARAEHALATLGPARGVALFGGTTGGGFGDWDGEFWLSDEGCVAGDANGDGRTNSDDRPLFIAALSSSLHDYILAGGSTPAWSRRACWLDVDLSGDFTSADLAALDALLSAGGCGSCPGDLDGDGQVAIADLSRLLASFGQTETATPSDGDLDDDRNVDLHDLVLLLSRFGYGC
jgi:hypothetical protein